MAHPFADVKGAPLCYASLRDGFAVLDIGCGLRHGAIEEATQGRRFRRKREAQGSGGLVACPGGCLVVEGAVS